MGNGHFSYRIFLDINSIKMNNSFYCTILPTEHHKENDEQYFTRTSMNLGLCIMNYSNGLQ